MEPGVEWAGTLGKEGEERVIDSIVGREKKKTRKLKENTTTPSIRIAGL